MNQRFINYLRDKIFSLPVRERYEALKPHLPALEQSGGYFENGYNPFSEEEQWEGASGAMNFVFPGIESYRASVEIFEASW